MSLFSSSLFQTKERRSDVRLKKVLKKVCDTFEDYGLTQAASGKLGCRRVRARDGTDLGVHSVGKNEGVRRTLKAYVSYR